MTLQKRTIIPLGPQHPVLPEPLHFDLVVEEETVVDVVPSIGYIHRGLELLVDRIEYPEFVNVAERICGICSFMHSMGYCQGIEALMNVEIPARAGYLRVFWAELSRIHSHLLWAGLAADAFGFENLFMQAWKVRETILDIHEKTAGGRVILGACQVGGVRRDVEAAMLAEIKQTLLDLRAPFEELAKVFLSDYSVQKRLTNVGVLTKETAIATGAVGPMARASGIEVDMRMIGPVHYKDFDFKIITDNGGDCMGRMIVRIREIQESFKILDQLLAKMPSGDVAVKVKGMPTGEVFMRVEQPRGEVIYYMKGNGTRNLERFRARTPTFANVPPMVAALKGAALADVPNIVLTIDPCISCTER